MSMEPDFLTLTIGKQKNIALIAHDGKKAELIQWCKDNAETLKKHFLKNYMEKVYIYVVKYENLLKKILLVI